VGLAVQSASTPSSLRDLASGAILIADMNNLAALEDSGDGRRVQLRAEIRGDDRSFLSAFVDDLGDLHINGQDLGPATAPISDDGEYEYSHIYRAADLPTLTLALGGRPREHILDVLQRSWTGPQSHELERLLRESAIPATFWNWS